MLIESVFVLTSALSFNGLVEDSARAYRSMAECKARLVTYEARHNAREGQKAEYTNEDQTELEIWQTNWKGKLELSSIYRCNEFKRN